MISNSKQRPRHNKCMQMLHSAEQGDTQHQERNRRDESSLGLGSSQGSCTWGETAKGGICGYGCFWGSRGYSKGVPLTAPLKAVSEDYPLTWPLEQPHFMSGDQSSALPRPRKPDFKPKPLLGNWCSSTVRVLTEQRWKGCRQGGSQGREPI